MKKLIMALALIAILPFAVSAQQYEQGNLCAEKTVAFETTNYDLWKEVMSYKKSSSNVLNVVDSSNFEIFSQARDARLNGDFKTFHELRAQLGLGQGNMKKSNFRFAS